MKAPESIRLQCWNESHERETRVAANPKWLSIIARLCWCWLAVLGIIWQIKYTLLTVDDVSCSIERQKRAWRRKHKKIYGEKKFVFNAFENFPSSHHFFDTDNLSTVTSKQKRTKFSAPWNFRRPSRAMKYRWIDIERLLGSSKLYISSILRLWKKWQFHCSFVDERKRWYWKIKNHCHLSSSYIIARGKILISFVFNMRFFLFSLRSTSRARVRSAIKKLRTNRIEFESAKSYLLANSWIPSSRRGGWEIPLSCVYVSLFARTFQQERTNINGKNEARGEARANRFIKLCEVCHSAISLSVFRFSRLPHIVISCVRSALCCYTLNEGEEGKNNFSLSLKVFLFSFSAESYLGESTHTRVGGMEGGENFHFIFVIFIVFLI